MSPTKVKQALKSGSIVLVFGLVVIGLGVFLRLKTRPLAPPPAAVPAPSAPALGKIEAPKIPALKIATPSAVAYRPPPARPVPSHEKLPVYLLEKQTLSEDQARKIAAALKFFSQPRAEKNRLSWAEKDKFLEVNLDRGGVKFFTNINSSLLTAPPPPEEELKTAAAALLVQAELADPSELDFRFNYLAVLGSNAYKAKSRGEAQIAEALFARRVGQFEALTDNPRSAPVRVWLTASLGIVRFEFSLPRINAGQKADYPTKSLNEAYDDLSAGRASLVYLKLAKGGAELLDPLLRLPIKTVAISRVRLAYYEGFEGTTLQPIYVFEGTAELDYRQKAEVVFYLPAIASEYLR